MLVVVERKGTMGMVRWAKRRAMRGWWGGCGVGVDIFFFGFLVFWGLEEVRLVGGEVG